MPAQARYRGRMATLVMTLASGLLAVAALLLAPGVVHSSDGTFSEAFLNNAVMQWTPLLIPLSAVCGWWAGRKALWGVLGIAITQFLTAYVYMQRDQGGAGSLQSFAYLYAGVLTVLCLLAVLVGGWLRRVWRPRATA